MEDCKNNPKLCAAKNPEFQKYNPPLTFKPGQNIYHTDYYPYTVNPPCYGRNNDFFKTTDAPSSWPLTIFLIIVFICILFYVLYLCAEPGPCAPPRLAPQRIPTCQPACNQPCQPACNQPAFNQPQQPAFNQPHQPAFNQPHQPAFNQPHQPAFNQPHQPAFNQPHQPAFNQPGQPTHNQPGSQLNPRSNFNQALQGEIQQSGQGWHGMAQNSNFRSNDNRFSMVPASNQPRRLENFQPAISNPRRPLTFNPNNNSHQNNNNLGRNNNNAFGTRNNIEIEGEYMNNGSRRVFYARGHEYVQGSMSRPPSPVRGSTTTRNNTLMGSTGGTQHQTKAYNQHRAAVDINLQMRR